MPVSGFEKISHEIMNTGARLVAVTKTQPADKIKELYDKGQRHFGENRVQEWMQKYEILPKDIAWHLIGSLQTNKVKYLIPHVYMIHSVDSARLLNEINSQASKYNCTVNCLLQFYIAQEETKHGFSLHEVTELFKNEPPTRFSNINFCGVMGMASFTDNKDQVRSEFSHLHSIFDTLKSTHFPENDTFKEISMGMSGDYPIAIQEGATLIRVGSLLFS